jgi:hypothetical protein
MKISVPPPTPRPLPTPTPQVLDLGSDTPPIVIDLDDPLNLIAKAGVRDASGKVVYRFIVYSGATYTAAGDYTQAQFNTAAMAILNGMLAPAS